MTPILNKVLVKPYPSDEISEGGIFVPLTARSVSNKVHIVKVGKGTPGKPMKLQPGDTGYRVKDHGTEVLIDDELYFLMEQDAIIALKK